MQHTSYTFAECKTYLEAKIRQLKTRGDEYGFTQDQRNTEVQVAESLVETLQAIEIIKRTPKGEYRDDLIELLLAQ